ncbi:gp436 family protein [Haemophilus pittmaniae]|uniref:gp436 family protein n=1 Tax=Haemophilus pittmaniae TaxID=249188 RepID=UPI000B94D555|nr:phage protein Gp36 family protein [Haemophilus pittmaniae]SNV66898.1 Mu-like prophage protein GP36 [Haemophilus pittmaniae]
MSYATLDDLRKRYGEADLLDLAQQSDGSWDTVKIYEALDDAAQTIDSYLAGRYTLPLTSVPAVLSRHCCYLARYYLEKNRATEQARQDYEDSLRFLEKVASGAISLGLSDSGETVESDNTVVMESGGSVWARERAKGFI